jgi:GGDEF domain-containing protein
MRSDKPWTYLDIKIDAFDLFTEVYGFVAGDEVIRFMAMLMGEVVDEQGTPDDFVGHPGRDNFIIITHSENAEKVQEILEERFNEEVRQHYTFIDRERGYLLIPDSSNGERRGELMTLGIGAVSTRTRQFSDIREVTELAAEVRRRGANDPDSSSDKPLLTTW